MRRQSSFGIWQTNFQAKVGMKLRYGKGLLGKCSAIRHSALVRTTIPRVGKSLTAVESVSWTPMVQLSRAPGRAPKTVAEMMSTMRWRKSSRQETELLPR